MKIGAHPRCVEVEYGWIYPDQKVWRSGEYSVHSVRQFLEKPSHADAVAAMSGGGLWNTLIMAAKAYALWRLGWAYAPDILEHFQRLCGVIGTSQENMSLYPNRVAANHARN